MEYTISEIAIVCELMIFRAEGDRFLNPTAAPGGQALTPVGDKHYDLISLTVTCWHEWHWTRLEELKRAAMVDEKQHAAMMEASKITYSRQFWFDITDVFYTQHPPEVRKMIEEMESKLEAELQKSR